MSKPNRLADSLLPPVMERTTFPLRKQEGRNALMVSLWLPVNLTQEDADRLCAHIQALAFE